MIEFIETHYLIFIYNIGLILTFSFIVYKALKASYHSDKEISGTMLAAIIWPAILVINIIAGIFKVLQKGVNGLITLPGTRFAKVHKVHDPQALLEDNEAIDNLENTTEIVSLDEVHGLTRK